MEKNERPWGNYEVIETRENFSIKMIVINPGCQPSYQYHSKREETWIILEGDAQVTIDDSITSSSRGDIIKVPVGAKHRIKNTSSSALLKFIEIQTGSYFGEDDIVRIQDDYGRH
jgi:mannose-6-phosphate isomerase